jgi:hypothetical protein
MRLRFAQSIAGSSFSFVEGQRIEVPDPVPSQFKDWLRRGIVVVERGPDMEVALEPRDIERAVARRQPQARRSGRRAPAKGAADDDP